MTLRPNQNPNPNMQIKFIWGALTFSMIFYTIILFVLGKFNGFRIPSELTPIESVSLSSLFLTYVSFSMFKRQSNMIVCLALNESVVIFGFLATYLSAEGNGFFIIANLLVGLGANVMMFPKESSSNKGYPS